MATIITMPRLSDTMEEGTVVKWHKNVGDKIAEGDILAEIETDKAIQEFESEFDGVLLYQGVAEGVSTNVDEVLAIIGNEGEDISGLIGGGTKATTEVKEEKSTPNETKTEEATTQTATQDTPKRSSSAHKETGIDYDVDGDGTTEDWELVY